MLEHYYDVRFKDQFEEFFGKTEIGRSFTTKLRGDAEVVIVEVAGNRGYNWHTLQA